MKSLDHNIIQSGLFGRPMPADEVLALLETNGLDSLPYAYATARPGRHMN